MATVSAFAATSCRQPPPLKSATPETVRPTYDDAGSLTKLEADSDRDGLIDMWAYMEGPRVVRVEVDENGDGTVDRWEYHKPLPGQERQARRETRDAQMPRPVQLRRGGLESPDKTIERIERATHADGKVSRWEYFENGFLVRVEADMNGDGKIDKWETYSDGSLSMMAIDTLHRGTADRRLVYRPDGTLDRIEIDPSGTGIFRPLPQPAK
jgi:YD repeat-containing protein